LEVTPLEDGAAGPLVRLHEAGSKPFGRPHFEADLNAPWQSPTLTTSQQQCLKLRLAADPWARDEARMRPDATVYTVKLSAAK
jgi:hypothetical protein